jgi:hypothetical protein|tara:strand:+ start:1380 stop:1712 length:333 start_codon:yes stop_codon:yes gene_type:complete
MKFEGSVQELRELLKGEFPDEVVSLDPLVKKIDKEIAEEFLTRDPHIPGYTYIGEPEWDEDGDYQPKEDEVVMRTKEGTLPLLYAIPDLILGIHENKYYLFTYYLFRKDS